MNTGNCPQHILKKTQINALSVDVEEYFHVSAFSKNIDPTDWGKYESRVDCSVAKLLDIFDCFDVKGTFFVLGWLADRNPQLVRRISDRGHEIGCHGYSHQLIYNQSRSAFESETNKAKAILEEITGKQIEGYRAASFSITEKSFWALDILHAAGFRYDSSIYPVRHDTYGNRNAKPYPHLLTLESGAKLAEFPISTIQLGPVRLPVGGGGYFRLYPYPFSRFALLSINRKNLPFVFYMHPWEIDCEQPRVKSNAISTFRHYNNIPRFEERLKKLLSQFRFCSMGQVLRDCGLL